MEQFIPRVKNEYNERLAPRFITDHSNVFDRLYQDSSNRIQNINLTDLTRRHFSAPREPRLSNIKIEDQLVYKHKQSQAKLNLLRAQKQAQDLSELKPSPQIDSLSKELAENGYKYTVARGKVMASPRNKSETGEVYEFKVKLPINQSDFPQQESQLEIQYQGKLHPKPRDQQFDRFRNTSSSNHTNGSVKQNQGHDLTLGTPHYTPSNIKLRENTTQERNNQLIPSRSIRERIVDRINQESTEIDPEFQNLQSVQAMLSLQSTKSAAVDRLANIRSTIESRLPPDRRPSSQKHKVNLHLNPPDNRQFRKQHSNQTVAFKSEMSSLLSPHNKESSNMSSDHIMDGKSLEQIRKMFPLRNQLLEPEAPPDFIDMNVLDRNKLWMEIKDRKIKEKLEEKQKKEVEGCTFKPALVPNKVNSTNSSSRMSGKLSMSPKRKRRQSSSYCEIYQAKQHMRCTSQESIYLSAGRIQKHSTLQPKSQIKRSESESKGAFYNQLSPTNRMFRYRGGFSEDGPIRKNLYGKLNKSKSDLNSPLRK